MSAPYELEWICTSCGKAQARNPQRYEYDEFLCDECEELAEAEYINHMRLVAREGTR